MIEGEPGIGKSALLAAFLARDSTHAARVLRIAGFSSEADLPYAGIDRLLLELPDEVAGLPEKLRRALTVATGREPGEPPDRFQVGLAVLSALGAGNAPLLCVVDDAHLLDSASLATLAFVARRLKAEAVLLVFATRPDDAVSETLAGIEVLRLEGLDSLSGVHLLNAQRAAGLDPGLAVRVVEQLGGHPLALTDLAGHADAERLALRALSIEPIPPGTLLQGFYRREIDLLPPASREFALLVVADTTGHIEVVRTAAAALDLPEDAARPLERTGLIELAEHVRFRHQLVRAAVYNSASSVDRRRAHLALEAASEQHGFSTAAAMHAATAAVARDATVADRLESLADESGARGALLSRAGLLVRASELTPDASVRDGRRLAAAESAVGAGAALLAAGQLDMIDEDRLAPVDQGRLLAVRGLAGAEIVEDLDGEPIGVVAPAHHQGRHRRHEHESAGPGATVSPEVAGDLPAAGGVADEGGAGDVERVEQAGEVVGVGVHLIAGPRLRGLAVPASVMGDRTEAFVGEEPGGGVPSVAVERPAVAQEHRGAVSGTPVLVEDLGAVVGLHEWHLKVSFLARAGAAVATGSPCRAHRARRTTCGA